MNEWLPGELNSAGDFRLIAANEPSAGNGNIQAARRPKAQSQTVAYFTRDASNLYIGIHASSPPTRNPSSPSISSDIGYEDLAPVGEDLIEILLDPTNRGTLPDDIYHIVVKSNGIGVFEKGIGIQPKIGRVQPWPGPTPRHAVSHTEYGWCAEIAIPITSLFAGTRPNVWGLNIARAEPSLGEYSDWARAPRYCYDPRTFGNLLWPD